MSLSTLLILCSIFVNTLLEADAVERKWRDVAFGRETSQKLTYNESSSSQFAVDGNATTCSRTERGSEWTVYFEQPRVIAQLRINTGSVYFGSHLEIFLGGYDSSVRSFCCYGGQSLGVMPVYVLSCSSGPMLGHSLTVSNRFITGVQLCDVQLMECEDGYFGSDCMLKCHCGDDSICDKISGRCPGRCTAGFSGTSCQDECEAGMFGVGCEIKCNCANDMPCNVSTGACPAYSAPGSHAHNCQTDDESVDVRYSLVVLGSLLFAACVVIMCLIVKLRWTQQELHKYCSHTQSEYVEIRMSTLDSAPAVYAELTTTNDLEEPNYEQDNE